MMGQAMVVKIAENNQAEQAFSPLLGGVSGVGSPRQAEGLKVKRLAMAVYSFSVMKQFKAIELLLVSTIFFG